MISYRTSDILKQVKRPMTLRYDLHDGGPYYRWNVVASSGPLQNNGFPDTLKMGSNGELEQYSMKLLWDVCKLDGFIMSDREMDATGMTITLSPMLQPKKADILKRLIKEKIELIYEKDKGNVNGYHLTSKYYTADEIGIVSKQITENNVPLNIISMNANDVITCLTMAGFDVDKVYFFQSGKRIIVTIRLPLRTIKADILKQVKMNDPQKLYELKYGYHNVSLRTMAYHLERADAGIHEMPWPSRITADGGALSEFSKNEIKKVADSYNMVIEKIISVRDEIAFIMRKK